ncbi:hypothetical protein OOJ09_22260 [Mesorhizobium qingshengii]|uniref:Uncharacterized protein n=1 Tax=Mesorhizobium qingshengii TaxID=1165689 RepID=A0ABT4QZF6_9HYPH|nr:hypothetical protein [Mesorhizobium qingshengii]MCZ8546920.1 hypothetical protein [Mesorhizobium qingshengii]
MTWRDDMIARHQDTIKSMREGVDWMEAGKFETGEVSATGQINDLTTESIAYYKQTISDLEKAIARLKAGNI